MQFFSQLIVSGLLSGAVYALVSLGVVVVYKASSVFNFAHGAIVAFMAYLLWYFMVELQLNILLCIICWLLAIGGITFLIQRLILYPLTGQPVLSVIIATLALAEIFTGFIILIWPEPGRTYPEFLRTGMMHLGSTVITSEELINFLVCAFSFIIFMVFFQKSRLGLSMRGTAEDHQLARSEGVKVNRIFILAWFVGIVIAAIGGILMANIYGVNHEPLSALGMKSLSVVILGGLESIPGAVIGGLMIGVLESIGSGYLDPFVGGGVNEVFPFLILLVVLLIRPYGLFGYQKIERV